MTINERSSIRVLRIQYTMRKQFNVDITRDYSSISFKSRKRRLGGVLSLGKLVGSRASWTRKNFPYILSSMTRNVNLFNVILYAALHLDTRLVSSVATCSICKGGVSFNKDVSDKLIELPVKTTTISLTCAALDAAIPFLIPNASSEDCLLVQSLGSLCGCPVEEGACKLCSDGTAILSPSNTLPFLEEQFGFVPTCELLEAYLLSQNSTNNTLCSVSQGLLAEYCGCNGATITKGCSFCPDGQLVPFPEKELNISGLPFKTCGQLESALSLVIEDGQETCMLFLGSRRGRKRQEVGTELKEVKVGYVI